MKARMQLFGLESVGNSAIDFRKDFDANAPVVERMIKASGIQPE